jgi:hypothetical protein
VIKIGIIDRYLDNWHTNHYPQYLKAAAETFGFDVGLTAAWAQENHPDGGLTTDEWCRQQGMVQCQTCEKLIASVDALMVMCADDCLPHEELAQVALASGKPLYCDKTFAPDVASARRMFARAEAHGTPVFTCSAQRFCLELTGYVQQRTLPAVFCATAGPGDIVNYSVHQFEMIERVMGTGAARCMAMTASGVRQVLYEYQDGRIATFTQSPKAPFRMMVSDGEAHSTEITVADYYVAFMHALLKFFMEKKPPVTKADTLEIMAMQQAAREALAAPGQWVTVPIYQ